MITIAADVISELAKSAAKTVFEKVKNYVVDLHNKEEIDFGYAFENYLNYSKDANGKIKTLLYRHEPKDIYSFYECIGLMNKNKEIDITDVNNLLAYGHKLIITGTGGIGKSVMMKHLFLNCIEKTQLIPVLIELRGLNETGEKDIDLIDFIYRIMDTYKFKLNKKYFEYSLETGCYLILIDGFDEVKNALSKKATKAIFDLCAKFPDNYYMVSSRPLEEFIGWDGFLELQSMALKKENALSLINKIEYDETVKKKFYEELKNTLFEKYETFASNPLLLTIMFLTFENRNSVPDKLNDFYEQAFTTLFHAHDATKGGYKRDISSQLGYEDFRVVFSYFCFKSFFKNEYEFSENKLLSYLALAKEKKIINRKFDSLNYLKDLTNSVCMLIHEGLNYRFSHRSFQEYFAAFYTVQLDDDQQKTFLTAWLKECFRDTTNYLDMLYDLQPQRFIKNILYAGLTELKNIFEKNNCLKEWLMNELYAGIGIDDNENYFVTVQNEYFCEIINRTCDIGGYENSVYYSQFIEIQQNDKIIKLLKQKYKYKLNHITFYQLTADNIFEKIVDNSWMYKRFIFAMKFLEEYDFSSIGRKKNFSSMVDEL